MSIKKQELRKYADPGLKFSPGSGVLHLKEIQYAVRAAVKNIASRRTLVLYFFNCKHVAAGFNEPEYTLFQMRDDYITLQRMPGGQEKWRKASLDNLGERYACFTNTCAFYRQKDEHLVTQYCEKTNQTGFYALNALQSQIMFARLQKRTKSKERKIIELMKAIPSVPRGLKNWIHREVLPHYIFYEYKRGGKPMKGYCTACRHDVLVSGAKHCGSGVCPRCKKAVTFKASGRAKRVWDRTTAQVLQKVSGNELVLRIFKISNGLRDWREPNLSVYENARLFIRWNDEIKVSVKPYYYAYGQGLLTHWKKGERPRMSYYQYNFECDICGHLYCKDLPDEMANTPWQYSQIERYYRSDGEPLEVMPYMSAYLKYPAIEYLVKLGLTKLTCQIAYDHYEKKAIIQNGKNLRETLGVGPEDIPVLQAVNVNTRQLELYKELKAQGIRADEKLLVWYGDRGIADIENIMIPLKYTTPSKIMRYVDEQYDRMKDSTTRYGARRYQQPSSVLSEYKDYLIMGSPLGYDFTDSFVLFPRNLPEAHDQASKLFDTKKKAIYNGLIRDAYISLLEQYRFTKNGLTLIPPKTANEIVKEGHTLHHCVHSYVERVANGKCVILFIRRTDSIKEPYYTLELRDNRVMQIHGNKHCAPTPEVEKFLDMWKRKKLLPAGAARAA